MFLGFILGYLVVGCIITFVLYLCLQYIDEDDLRSYELNDYQKKSFNSLKNRFETKTKSSVIISVLISPTIVIFSLIEGVISKIKNMVKG